MGYIARIAPGCGAQQELPAFGSLGSALAIAGANACSCASCVAGCSGCCSAISNKSWSVPMLSSEGCSWICCSLSCWISWLLDIIRFWICESFATSCTWCRSSAFQIACLFFPTLQ